MERARKETKATGLLRQDSRQSCVTDLAVLSKKLSLTGRKETESQIDLHHILL